MSYPSEIAPLVAALENAFNAVVITSVVDNQGNHPIIYVNPAFCEMTGYKPEEVYGLDPRFLQGPQTSQIIIEDMRRCLKNNEVFHGSSINYRKDGRPYHVEWNISPVKNSAGQTTHYVSVQHSINHEKSSGRINNLLAAALNVTEDAVIIADVTGHIEFVNEGFLKLSGYSLHEVIGRRPAIVQSGQHDKAFYKKMWSQLKKGQTFKSTFTNKHKSGEDYHVEQTITPLFDQSGQITHYVSISKDLSSRVVEEKAFREKIKFDVLTQALVRREGEVELEKSYFQFQEGEVPFCVAVIDLDHFKNINDTWGHNVGDEILRQFANTMMSVMRSSDHFIRWGGEEFLVLMNDVHLDNAIEILNRMRLTINQFEHYKVGKISFSAGVTEINHHQSMASVIESADKALYRAKSSGRNNIQFQ